MKVERVLSWLAIFVLANTTATATGRFVLLRLVRTLI